MAIPHMGKPGAGGDVGAGDAGRFAALACEAAERARAAALAADGAVGAGRSMKLEEADQAAATAFRHLAQALDAATALECRVAANMDPEQATSTPELRAAIEASDRAQTVVGAATDLVSKVRQRPQEGAAGTDRVSPA